MESIEKWTEDVTDKYVQDYANKAIERINAGDDYDDILEDYEKMSEKEAKKAAFRSKNQMANLTSMTTRVRAQSAGIKKAIWRTQKDPKVRDRHAILEGVEFDLDKGAPKYEDSNGYDGKVGSFTGEYIFPGEEYNCRCYYDMVIPDRYASNYDLEEGGEGEEDWESDNDIREVEEPW